eukprot:1469042-Prymnesium_polylepis.1
MRVSRRRECFGACGGLRFGSARQRAAAGRARSRLRVTGPTPDTASRAATEPKGWASTMAATAVARTPGTACSSAAVTSLMEVRGPADALSASMLKRSSSEARVTAPMPGTCGD